MTTSFLLSFLLLAVPADGDLPRSSLKAKDLGGFGKTVNGFFAALEADDRAEQKDNLDDLEKALERVSKRAKLEDRLLLEHVGDWELILEQSKELPRDLKSIPGKGFTRYVFEEPWDQTRVVSMLSVPGDYTSADEPFPVVVALRPSSGATGSELEEEVAAQAAAAYGDLVESAIILVPIGLERGEGRDAATTEVEGSWLTDDGLYAFFTGFRVVLETLSYDRSRVALDGWGSAGMDALRLATSAPSFFSGVINRSGLVEGQGLILENLYNRKVLYVNGAEDDGSTDPAPLSGVEGVDLQTIDEAGSALAPSAETVATIAQWVAECRRELAPAEIRYQLGDLRFQSADWCKAAQINKRPTAKPGDKDFPRFHVRVDRDANTIDIDSVNVLELWVYLSDAIVDLDQPVSIRVNGEERTRKTLRRDIRHLLENRFFNNSGDNGLYTASVLIEDIDPNLDGGTR